METYREFLNRINSFEHKKWSFAPGDFMGNPSLIKKVKPDNSFCPFYGDTVVFDLSDVTKKRLEKWLDKLYDEVPECFAKRLATDTFHMTLHDLSNSEKQEEVTAELTKNRKMLQVLSEKKHFAAFDTIKMKSNCIFNMVNTSLVLGLYPADEKEYKKLMTLYEIFNEVKKLPYPLTPHITLAYYNVNGFSDASARKLEKLAGQINMEEYEQELEIELKTKELYYQHFDSMNHYENVFLFFE